jgi:putative flippase GtrA
VNLRAFLASELILYGLVSAIALLVDLALLTLLTSLGVHYLVAATISFLSGGVVAYFLSVRFVFSHHRMQVRSVEAMAFIALGLVGLVMNTMVMAIVVGKAGASVIVGKAAAACCTFGVNFLLRKLVLFTAPKDRARSADSH